MSQSSRRILISGGLAAGGVETHLGLLCRVLRESGAEVVVAAVSCNWRPASVERLTALGVRLLVPHWGNGSTSILGKVQALASWPFQLPRTFDTLYCIGRGRMHLQMRRFLRQGGISIYHEIVTAPMHGDRAARTAARMDGLIANSAPVALQMRSVIPLLPIRTIPFLTSSAATPTPAARPSPARRELRIAYMGRIVRHKRIDHLVYEWPRLCSMMGPARLDVHGGDFEGERLIPDLEAFVKENGLSDQIRFHGPYDSTRDIPAIAGRADIIVLPSIFEGLPLTLIEAMQRGTPVVATAAGGTADLADGNPDVRITGLDWSEFVDGLVDMAHHVRSGQTDPLRLHAWTERRYGYDAVARQWVQALCSPDEFWSETVAAAA